MKPLGKAIKTAHLENRPWQQQLSKFILLNYRSTSHSTTKIPPAQLLHNRQIRGKLPTLIRKFKVLNRHQEARKNDEKAKEAGRRYANERRATKYSGINEADTVLVRLL